MQNTLTKFLILTLFMAGIVKINLETFRSDVPSLVIITLIGSVILFIYFPYNRLFNNKKRD